MLYAANADASIWIGSSPASIVVEQTNGSASQKTFFMSNSTLDGNWHVLKVVVDPTGLQVRLKYSIRFIFSCFSLFKIDFVCKILNV